MTIADALKKIGNNYVISAQCNNCGMRQQVKIPKGVSVSDYFNQSSGLCQHCGCATLSRAQPSTIKKINEKLDSSKKELMDFWRGNENDNRKRKK